MRVVYINTEIFIDRHGFDLIGPAFCLMSDMVFWSLLVNHLHIVVLSVRCSYKGLQEVQFCFHT